MTSMIVQVYDAFKSIGIEDATARDAAIALSDNPQAITELRGDMTSEFAKVRSEMAGEFAQVRSEMASEFGKVRSEMAGEFAKVRSEIADFRYEVNTGLVRLYTMFGILVAGVVSIVGKLYF